MNRKLIFEAPHLPGGLIFTEVCKAVVESDRVDYAAHARALRFKGSEWTAEPVSELRFAPERFDLGVLVADVIKARGGTLSADDLDNAYRALDEAHIAPPRDPTLDEEKPVPAVILQLNRELGTAGRQLEAELGPIRANVIAAYVAAAIAANR